MSFSPAGIANFNRMHPRIKMSRLNLIICCGGIDRYLRPIDSVLNSVAQLSGKIGVGHMSVRENRHRKIALRNLTGLSLMAPLGLVGCSHAPEYSIFGSFFPAWIFCSVGGLVLMAVARILIARTAIAEYLAAPVLFYLSMAIFLACMLWLLFYS
jgi:hypothetical protein